MNSGRRNGSSDSPRCRPPGAASRRSHAGSGPRDSQRRSFAGRMSLSVATRLSIVGLREAPRNGTVVGVTINTLCNVMGAGVLALPLAAMNASVGLAVLLLTYVALMSAYSVYCLVAGCDATGRFSVTEVTAFSLFPPRTFEVYCADRRRVAEEEQQQQGTYGDGSSTAAPYSALTGLPDGDVGDLTTSDFRAWRLTHARDELDRRRWRRIVTVFVESVVFCTNYGTLIIYARVIADSMPPVVGNVFRQLHWTPQPLLLSEVFWLAASGVVFFLLSCAKNMEELKWSSLLGFVTILYIVVAVFYRFFTASWADDIEERGQGFPVIDPKKRGDILWLGFPVTALRTVSTYGVAFGYHFNVPYFYSEIKNRVPSEMMRSVAYSFPIIVGSYAVSGVFGYLTFGNLVASRKAGGNIVGNYGDDDTLLNIGRLGLFAHFACVFPIVSICCRRGIHRLLMTGLTWNEQTALMGMEVEDLEENEAARGAAATPISATPTSLVGGGSERTPLLAGGSALPRTASTGNTFTTQGCRRNPTDSNGSSGLVAVRPGPLTAPMDPADLDRDVGSPNDTTRLAIVVEALLLVTTVVVLAGTVSGISSVIDIIGTLFGVFLILIVPGVVGMRIFSGRFVFLSAPGQPSVGGEGGGSLHAGDDDVVGITTLAGPHVALMRRAGLKWWVCLLSAVTGIAFTTVGTAMFIADRLSKKRD